ncbi:hypothetical protein ARMGADRAFT_1086017 [Armillaria gallica]|uniref:BTB domain-containing protein n=1 Tax=Armillaria gallica TaxID=47427 RepID=A0A2H3CV52_ARMGA|nr:hypothetical protein ARMGADRAFT_1086017 [Armillaria gallica]
MQDEKNDLESYPPASPQSDAADIASDVQQPGEASKFRNVNFYWENSTFLVEDELFRAPRYQFIKHSETFKAMFTLPQADADAVEGNTDDKPIHLYGVEDSLVRVPKHNLVGKSEVFDSMLSLPQGGSEPEGISDEKPIQLAGIKKVDFERLLQIIYPIDSTKLPDLSVNGWVSVLTLSSLWRMSVRKTAMERLTSRLSQISPVDRILLGRRYSVAHWISSGYEELASREGVVSLEEAERVGLGTALRIEHIRESLFAVGLRKQPRTNTPIYCGSCGSHYCCGRNHLSRPPFDSHMVKEKVGETFEAELKDVQAEGAGFE